MFSGISSPYRVIARRGRSGGVWELLTFTLANGQRALPLFSFSEEAGLFVRLGGYEAEGWDVREIGRGELAGLLSREWVEFDCVALDPLPVTAGVENLLVSVGRRVFLDSLLGRGRYWFSERRGETRTKVRAVPDGAALRSFSSR